MIPPKVNVIVPAYNCASYLQRSLESVLAQDYNGLEILIVNDGSTDETEGIAKRYLGNPRIKYVKIENGGVSNALNVGLSQVAGEYVAFLHADDICLPGRIAKQISFMERHKRYDVSYTNARYFLEGTGRTIESPYVHFSGDIFYFLKKNNFIHISSAMFRSGIFEAVRFNGGLACHEDWDLFLRLARRGVGFGYVDEILTGICVHPESLTFNTAVMDATRSEVGFRAKELWYDFKRDINPFSIKGIAGLGRYIKFKARAFLTGFPNKKRFDYKAPKEII